MQDMYPNETTTETPASTGIGTAGKVIATIVGVGFMWFAYTSVLPNIPIVGPIIGVTSNPPQLEQAIGLDFNSSNRETEAAEAPVVVNSDSGERLGDAGIQSFELQDAATEARFVEANERLFGAPLSTFGFTDAQFVASSYRWCASIEAYGRDGAYRELRSVVAAQTTSSDFAAQWNLATTTNGLIEQYLCS